MPPQDPNKDGNKIQKEVDEQIIHLTSPFAKPEKPRYTPNPDLKALRTFQGDVEETIHTKNTSVVKVFVAEQKREEKPSLELPKKETTKAKTFLTRGFLFFVGLGLFIAGTVTLIIIYSNLASNIAPIPVTISRNIIPYSDQSIVDIQNSNASNGNQILKSLLDKKKTYNKPVGSVLYSQFLYNKTELPSSVFFQNLAISAPSSLSRSLGEKYMAGIYSYDINGIFLLFSTENYGATYSGMLKWESGVTSDLSPLFSLSNMSVASGTPISSPIFKDDSFNNQDVRILRDSSGQIVLVYGFIDKSILLITENEKIYQALVNKYRNNKLVR